MKLNSIAGKLFPNSVHPFLLLAFLCVPYFYIRPGGFDFSSGNSFTLGDFFLVLAFLVIFNPVRLKQISLNLNKQFLLLIGTGCFFVFLCVVSGITSKLFYNSTFTLHWPSWLSGTVQYAFILIGFPILAGYFLCGRNIKPAMRFIALGYLPPMILNILLLPPNAFPWLREMFFWANRALGTYGNANSFAEVILVTFPLYVYLIATDKGWWQKIGYIGALASLVSMLITGSFSGIFVLISVLLVNAVLLLLWHGNPLRKYMKSIILHILVMVALFACCYAIIRHYSPIMTIALENRFFPDTQDEAPPANLAKDETISVIEAEIAKRGSAGIRMELNNRAIKLIKERNGGIFAGHGMRQTLLLPEFTIGGTKFDVHMIYLLLWVEGGLILSLTFIAYLLLLVRNCFNLAKSYPAEALTIFSSVLGFILFGMFTTQEYLRYFWVPLLPAFITSSERVISRKPKKAN